jgi:hypothetical protein
MKSTNPWSARVVAEIGLEDAVAAIEHFVENLPADRFSIYISDRLFKAAREMEDKALSLPTCNTSRLLVTQKLSQDNKVPGVNAILNDVWVYGSTTGRIDSSKENPCYGNSEMAARASGKKGFGGGIAGADHSDSTLCAECFVWSDNKGPSRHAVRCSRFGNTLRKNVVQPKQEIEGEIWPR